MKLIGNYLYRLLGLWLFWFWAPALDVVAFLSDPYIPSFTFEKEIYWAIALVGFIVANVKLFAEEESEKRLLQEWIKELEDSRANIRFRKLDDFCYVPSSQHEIPFTDLQIERDYQTGLDKNGLPGWIVIASRLEGEKKSAESGELLWEVIEADLPPLFTFDKSNEGSFKWHSGSPFSTINEWKDTFSARYEIPIKLSQRNNSSMFAQELKSLGSYRIVLRYWTKRGIDNMSETHNLTLEGTFEDIRTDLCKHWEWKFKELATMAKCQ